MRDKRRRNPPSRKRGGDPPPELWIVWDPEIVAETDYVALVTACGDLVRASGGLGVERRNGAAPDVAAILREAGE